MMIRIEDILIKAWKKGYRDELLKIVEQLRRQHPYENLEHIYSKALEIYKTKSNDTTTTNPTDSKANP